MAEEAPLQAEGGLAALSLGVWVSARSQVLAVHCPALASDLLPYG